MQIHLPLRQHIAKYRALAQSLRLWVMEVFAWWVTMFGDRAARLDVQRATIEARAQTRDLIFLMMVSQMTFRRRERAWMRPPSVQRGFRYAWRSVRPLRLYTRGLNLKSLKDIRRVLDDIERIVARLIARVPRTISTGRLVITWSVSVLAGVRLSAADVDAPDTS